MKKQSFAVMLAALLFALCASHTAAAADTKSQLIQVQTQLQLMQDNMSRMQQSFDERMGVMKDLLTQQIDNVNKMGATVQNLQKTLGQQTSDAGSKVDQISGHSSRVGAAQDMVQFGVELPAIMQAGGWKTPEMVSRYTARLDVRRSGSAKLAVLQNRA